MEFLLVNNEVAPLDRMNFLGLLCKVRAGQGARCSAVDTEPGERLMGYWNELEIFRSADGCQELANKMAEEIRTKHGKYGSKVLLSTAVTHIGLSKQGVVLGSRKVVDEAKGKLADKPLPLLNYDYVILAIPPSVWADVKITADSKDAHPKDEIGLMGMGPAVKFFSDMKERFWIKDNAAPSGGSLTLGQVWEGTDNQTRVGNQGIVLSVFAGPIIPTPIVAGGADRRAPNPGEFDRELKRLYPGFNTRDRNKWRFADWPNVPFIKTGYASPAKGDIFKLGEKLSEPFRDRLFFAGEHTHMAFFGYMEGALRSGKRAANKLMLQSCDLLKKPAPASSEPPRVASAAPIRARTASEYETDISLKEHSSTDYPGEAGSPFLDEELFVGESEEEWEPRAEALVAESPFVGALEERRSRFDEDQLEEEEAPEDLEELYGHVHEHELDQGEELVELKETEGLESDEEEYFEYDVPALGSATNDHPLREIADGQRGQLPDDILAAILTTGESDANDLTNRVFWRNHPDLSRKTLDPKDPKQKALRDEWGMILRMQVKPIIWLRQIIDQLDRHRGDIPREFLLGWIAAESDGKVSTVSTLGERGYFQIMWQSGEAKEQLGLTRGEFLRLSTDREFSIEKGVQLAKTYRQHFLRKYPSVPDGSDLLWRLTKGRHALPTALDKVLDRLVKAGKTITWQAVSQSLPKMASRVNLTLDFAAKLKPLADLVPAPPATTPEFYAESAPWISGSGYEDRVSEVAAEQATEEDLAEFESQVSGPRTEVRALQESINRWRVENGQTPIKEDGLLGAETKKAVLEFQQASGFKRVHQDGIAGPATRERLTLLLDILANAVDRRRLVEFVGSAGFRSLEEPTQTEVLERIRSFQRSPGTLDNIRHLTNLVTQTGFELLPRSSQKLMLRVLAARPDDAQLADNLGQLAGSPGFRNLEGPTQTWVLKRIEGYAGNRDKIDNLENLITATNNFDQLSKESRNVMLVALANHPKDTRLVDNFRRAADRIDFRQLDQPTQTDVLHRIVAYPRDPRNVDNLMSLVTTPGFGNLAPDVRAQVLDGLPSHFGNVQLNPTSIGNMMSLITASGFEKLRREVRDLMLDVQANRPDNEPLANALRNLAENPRFRHDHRMARQTILRVADSIP
jgi:hypothetical protein